MSIQDLIRVWTKSHDRECQPNEERVLPDHQIGEVLSQEELRSITGGTGGLSDTERAFNVQTAMNSW